MFNFFIFYFYILCNKNPLDNLKINTNYFFLERCKLEYILNKKNIIFLFNITSFSIFINYKNTYLKLDIYIYSYKKLKKNVYLKINNHEYNNNYKYMFLLICR
jgi:hypothetical protein